MDRRAIPAGLSRIVSALEPTYFIQGERGALRFFPQFMLWMIWMAHPSSLPREDAGKLVGIGLEAWADSQLAGDLRPTICSRTCIMRRRPRYA